MDMVEVAQLRAVEKSRRNDKKPNSRANLALRLVSGNAATSLGFRVSTTGEPLRAAYAESAQRRRPASAPDFFSKTEFADDTRG